MADIWPAVALAGLAFALYASMALRLAQGSYSDYWNLAFDYDPQKYVDLLAGPMEWRGDAKHPLYALLRPLAWPLVAAGAAPKAAAGLLMAGFAAASVALVFLAMRVLGAGRPLAWLLAGAFALSGSQLHLAMIPESYGPAMTGLLAGWLLGLRAARGDGDAAGWSIAAAVFSMGVTLTNVVQPGLVRLAQAIGEKRGFAGLLRWGLAVLAISALLAALVWHEALGELLADPALALKEVYWMRAAVSEKVGLAVLVPSFAAWSFVTPGHEVVPIAGGIGMWDIRSARYGLLGWAACAAWVAVLLLGVAGWMRAAAWRRMGFVLIAAVAFNLLLHIDFQFRGSVYLYAAHLHVPLYLLGAGGLVLGMRERAGALVVALLLAGLFAAQNLPLAWSFAAGFDAVDVPCPAPCAAGGV